MNARANLARVARALGELTDRVVFVGGSTVELYITDPNAGPARWHARRLLDSVLGIRTAHAARSFRSKVFVSRA